MTPNLSRNKSAAIMEQLRELGENVIFAAKKQITSPKVEVIVFSPSSARLVVAKNVSQERCSSAWISLDPGMI